MFTWDSSGCMSRESVSIMYYRRHTNRLIESAEIERQILQLHTLKCTSSCNHQQSRQWNIISSCTRCNSVVIFVRKFKRKNKAEPLWDLAEDKQDWWGTVWHHHGDWTWQPLGTLTSLNHQVGINGHSLLFHLHTVSEAPNMPADRNEWQQTKRQRMIWQLIIKAAFCSLSTDSESTALWGWRRQSVLGTRCCGASWWRWMQWAA